MKSFFLLLLLFIILIAGCTQDGGQSIITPSIKSEGLNIINFTTNFNTIRIQESTSLNLKLRNAGPFDSTNIKAVLYGYGLLIKQDLKNETEIILRDGKEDVLSWVLRAPVVLSQTESTQYTVNARVYYWYNFSGFKQIAFVPSNYIGDSPTVYSNVESGPLSVNIQTISPLRSLEGMGVNFSLTIEVNKDEVGSVNYYNDTLRSYHLNELRIIVPATWIPLDNLYAFNFITRGDEVEYKLNFDDLQEMYNNNTYSCPGSGLSNCDCTVSNSAQCVRISAAINNLWLIRGEKARLVMMFYHPDVTDPTIDVVQVKGNYGYEIDTKEFTGPLVITVRGD